MASFIIGDYKYIVIDLENKYVRAEAYDKTLTTYSDIESTVTYEDEEYTVTDISYCFYECVNLTKAPSHLPNTITTMRSCFESCTSLIKTPQNCPTKVTNMESCFANCTSLQTVDNNFHLRSGNLERCFYNCESLLHAPDIPSNSSVIECFKNCDQLNGNIIVSAISSHLAAEQMFRDTTKDIYILGSDNIANNWRIIANEYKNVHYEADDHSAPQPSLTAIRVNESGEPDSSGKWVLITKGYYLSQDYLPSGWSPRVIDETIIKDGDSQQQIPVLPGSPVELPIFYIDDEEPHSFTYSLGDSYKTSSITVNIARTMALLDFQGKKGNIYNDIPGMGMAIGKRAERNGLDIRFPTVIGEGLVPATDFKYNPITSPSGNPQEQNWYERSGEIEPYVYTLTKDTSVISSKIYYEQIEGSEYVDLENYQLIVGKYNKQNNNATFIVGNGTEEERSNIMEIGKTITIGNSGGSESYMYLDYHSIQMFDKENAISQEKPYFWISDLRNKEGTYFINETILSKGKSWYRYDLEFAPALVNDEYIVKINDVIHDVIKDENGFEFRDDDPDIPPVETPIEVSYQSISFKLKAFTLGYRNSSYSVGPFSYAEGYSVAASGSASHAEGYYTTASGRDSHAEGYYTTASGRDSHAEGYYTTASFYSSHAEGRKTTASGGASHAEGYGNTASGTYTHAEGCDTIASSYASHAEGYNTTASGFYSHAQNEATIADYTSQTAIGKYNDNQSNTAFEIGNGTSDTARSNAFTVGWDGSVKASGKITDGNGNVLANKIDSSLLKDYIVEEGTSSGWTYRKWKNGKVEAWYDYNPSASATYTTWVTPIKYRDITLSIPSGIFSSEPKVFATSKNNQVWAVSAVPSSATSVTVRLATLSSAAIISRFRLYAINY